MPIFVEHYFSPAFIVELLQVMVRDGFYEVAAGLQHYYNLNPPNADNLQIWETLSALEQALLKRLISESSGPVYHKDS